MSSLIFKRISFTPEASGSGSTTVPETTEVTWKVTLQAGTYTFKCDPHPKMVGEASHLL